MTLGASPVGAITVEQLDGRSVVGALVLFYLLAMGLALIPSLPAPIVVLSVVLALSFVPGTLFLLLMLEEPTLDARFVTLSLGLSLLLVMAMGVILNVFLPVLGIERPMSRPYLVGATTTLVLSLGFVAAVRLEHRCIAVPAYQTRLGTLLALALLPLYSIIAVTVLNRTGVNEPILILLTLVAVVPLVASRTSTEGWHAFGIWSMALAVLYHDSLWTYSNFSGSPGVVTAWEARRWTPGTVEADMTSMGLLQNGVLFPAFARLSGVDILIQMEVVNPFFVAFIPVAMFVTFRRLVDTRSAFVAAALFVFAHPFYLQYPTAGRAATPVLFLVLFGVALTDVDLSGVKASFLLLLFAIGVVTTHYGTAYYVMAALLGGVALVGSYPVLNRLQVARDVPAGNDGRVDSFVQKVPRSFPITHGNGLSVPLALYYSTAAIAWYMFTVEGAKFAIFPRHVYSIMSQLIAGSLFAGGSAQRLQRAYGGEAIQLSKGLYVSFAVLMALGILVVYYYRFVADIEFNFHDEFLALSTVMFGLFGVTVLFQTWGGGRPMMITFSYTAVFAVLGFCWCVAKLQGLVVWGRSVIGDLLNIASVPNAAGGRTAFAVLLAVFFLLNTGVASSVALDGRAPNNVPLQAEIADSDNPEVRANLYWTTDIETHVWINDHHPGTTDPSAKVYGDTLATSQIDWYRPVIELRTEGHRAYYESWKPRRDIVQVLDSNGSFPLGYVLVLGHNVRMGIVMTPNSMVPFNQLVPALSQRNRIYTTGDSSVYYRGNISHLARQ